jgi:predicted small lipoprotein YifL
MSELTMPAPDRKAALSLLRAAFSTALEEASDASALAFSCFIVIVRRLSLGRIAVTPPLPPLTSRLLGILALALALTSLGGCGRRGPLELPPETQARGAFLRAQAEAEQAKAAAHGAPPPPPPPAGAPPPPIPGTVGNRPPDQYPFLLDPLL